MFLETKTKPKPSQNQPYMRLLRQKAPCKAGFGWLSWFWPKTSQNDQILIILATSWSTWSNRQNQSKPALRAPFFGGFGRFLADLARPPKPTKIGQKGRAQGWFLAVLVGFGPANFAGILPAKLARPKPAKTGQNRPKPTKNWPVLAGFGRFGPDLRPAPSLGPRGSDRPTGSSQSTVQCWTRPDQAGPALYSARPGQSSWPSTVQCSAWPAELDQSTVQCSDGAKPS